MLFIFCDELCGCLLVGFVVVVFIVWLCGLFFFMFVCFVRMYICKIYDVGI